MTSSSHPATPALAESQPPRTRLAEQILPAFRSGEDRGAISGCLFLLSMDHAQPFTHQDDRECDRTCSHNGQRPSCHIEGLFGG